MALFVSLWIKLFFVFTPFFALSMFLSMTEGYDESRRRRLALAVSMAVTVLCFILFFAGNQLFTLFGITLDSFRIGAGALLFLSGVGLVQGKHGTTSVSPGDDVAVVPLGMPIIVGPATTGTLLVMGAELEGVKEKMLGSLALLFAVVCIAGLLLMASLIHRALGARGINILSKLTGLILAALSAQMIMTGIKGFF
ncbi:MAG: MarC family protein [Proteobacteria bacterium]|nr:MarC family protein [Pseudomonadota bacterium]MBU4470336.1 MarC family protein [Pseudomonadota bacterium]MCG2752747.1 MarC family protein [Desulfobacteraceae bacterium]